MQDILIDDKGVIRQTVENYNIDMLLLVGFI
jgi:hypothetical protein